MILAFNAQQLTREMDEDIKNVSLLDQINNLF